MMADDIRHATIENSHTHVFSTYVMHVWPSIRAYIIKEIQPYWPFREKVAVEDQITMKGRRMMVPASLQKDHRINCMLIRLLACGSIYWININTNKANTITKMPYLLDFQSIQPKDKIISHEILRRLWESVTLDIFSK